jgi:hypothetical protein
MYRNLHGGIPIHSHRLGHESYSRQSAGPYPWGSASSESLPCPGASLPSPAIGGIIIGNISGISIHLGHIGLKVLAVIILGGLDSIIGAIVGGFIIGILENFAGVYLDSLWEEASKR